MEQRRKPLAVSLSIRLVAVALWHGKTHLAMAAKAELCKAAFNKIWGSHRERGVPSNL